MDTNFKATLLACIFTLLLSVAGAYGVLKLDDAELKTKVEYIEARQAEQMNQISRLIDTYSERTDCSMTKLDATMDKFAEKVGCLSESIARLEERMKPIEARGDVNGT